MFRHGETSCTGQPALPSEMVGVALSFLDGRSLTSFEAASRGTKLAVQGHPNLFKTLLVRNQHRSYSYSLARLPTSRATLRFIP